MKRALVIISCCIVVVGIVLAAAVFWIIWMPESKAREMAIHHNSLSSDDWKRIYEEASVLRANVAVHTTPLKINGVLMPQSFHQLGFEDCFVSKDLIEMVYGGSFMMNRARVEVHFSSTEHQNAGVWYLGWSKGWQCGYIPPAGETRQTKTPSHFFTNPSRNCTYVERRAM